VRVVTGFLDHILYLQIKVPFKSNRPPKALAEAAFKEEMHGGLL
jgi:hypothetical protein